MMLTLVEFLVMEKSKVVVVVKRMMLMLVELIVMVE